MMKRIVLMPTAALVAALVVGVAGAALAAGGAQTETERFHKLTQTFDDVVPCTGEEATITTVTNGVIHTTELPNGTFHITGTETGTFTAVTDTTTYTGRFTVWFGGNSNRRNQANTFTFNLRGTAEDGTVIKSHVVDHFSSSASEPPKLNVFFREDCSA
jgi:hypothetical protein